MKWLLCVTLALTASGCCSGLRYTVDQCNEDYRECTRDLSSCQAGMSSTSSAAAERTDHKGCPPSVNPEVLAEHIERAGWDYNRKDDLFVINVAGQEDQHRLVLHAAEGDQLNIVAPDIGVVSLDNQSRERMFVNLMILGYMMNLNFEHQFVKYSWDSSDGEVWAIITLPLEDGITAETLAVYVNYMIRVLEKDNMSALLAGLSDLSEYEIKELFRSQHDSNDSGFQF